MDPMIRKRMTKTIKVYPYIGTQMGDKQYGQPYFIKAYITNREKVVQTANGSEYVLYTILYIDVSQITDTILPKLSEIWNGKCFVPCTVEKLSLHDGIHLGQSNIDNHDDCDSGELVMLSLRSGIHLDTENNESCETEGEFTLEMSKLNGRFRLKDTTKPVQFVTIRPEDEVHLPHIGRVPVATVRMYQGLKSDYDIMEVIV